MFAFGGYFKNERLYYDTIRSWGKSHEPDSIFDLYERNNTSWKDSRLAELDSLLACNSLFQTEGAVTSISCIMIVFTRQPLRARRTKYHPGSVIIVVVCSLQAGVLYECTTSDCRVWLGTLARYKSCYSESSTRVGVLQVDCSVSTGRNSN